MAIHRVGPAEDPVRTPLGGVLVTIDDLEALLSLLSGQLGSPSPEGSPTVQFNGGYFTEASDLRRLSDEELKSVRVVTPDTQVILGESEAVVIGTESMGQRIYREWARERPAQYPRYITLLEGRKISRSTMTIAILAAASIPAVILLDAVYHVSFYLTLPIGAAAVVSGWFFMAKLFSAPILPKDFARIVPSTLDEYRRNRADRVIPRWSLILTAVSVIVAIAAIVVSVLIAK